VDTQQFNLRLCSAISAGVPERNRNTTNLMEGTGDTWQLIEVGKFLLLGLELQL
jgi:hypothetical protein